MVAPGADPAADDLPGDSPTRDRRGWRLARDAEGADLMAASEAADGRQGVPAAAARADGGSGRRGGGAAVDARWRQATPAAPRCGSGCAVEAAARPTGRGGGRQHRPAVVAAQASSEVARAAAAIGGIGSACERWGQLQARRMAAR
ncbi:hypothetical protein Syun_008807 [Stephania yunnanensis]|uniref:Uncharacterized protein n=1 Tax=Stephania yunnanensis TaxID=152371 RepID=A0AAP0KF04_9MAGN